MTDALIELRDAILCYRGRRITPEPLSLAVPRGLTVLLGRNGSGKTTLLRALLGESVLRSGEVTLAGRALSTYRPAELSSWFAYVPQEPLFPPDMPVRDFLALAFLPALGLLGRLQPAQQKAIDAELSRFGVERLGASRLDEISTGERQRAFLARALLQRPRALLLDEPTNHLDPAGVLEFWSALVAAREAAGIDVILSTHDIAFAKRHATAVIALENGRAVHCGPAESFWQENGPQRLFGLP